MTADEAESAYKRITKEIIDQINGLLSFGGHELCVVGNQYAIKNIGDQVKLSASSIKVPDRKYINDYVRQLESEPRASLILSHPALTRK